MGFNVLFVLDSHLYAADNFPFIPVDTADIHLAEETMQAKCLFPLRPTATCLGNLDLRSSHSKLALVRESVLCDMST